MQSAATMYENVLSLTKYANLKAQKVLLIEPRGLRTRSKKCIYVDIIGIFYRFLYFN